MVDSEVLKTFGIENHQLQGLKTGHINDTYLVSDINGVNTYVLQRINSQVFKSPELVLENFTKISDFLDSSASFHYRLPELVRNSYKHHQDWWRLFRYEKGTHTILSSSDTAIAEKAALAYANFGFSLSAMDTNQIDEVIPDFHNLEFRQDQLKWAVNQDIKGRKALVRDFLSELDEFSDITSTYTSLIQDFPQRIVHNDTKLANLLFDDNNEVVCVIDLDTAMPGYIMNDFGDMVRSICNPIGEGAENISDVYFDDKLFEVLKESYLYGWQGELSQMEVDNLTFGVSAIIYEQLIRFLTDYLNGDQYYHISFPDENRVRAEVHLQLLKDFTRKTL